MFTDLVIKSLEPGSMPYKRYEKRYAKDEEEPREGFGIQISPKGTKTFLFAYRFGGRQRFMKLGVYGVRNGKITLKEAGVEWAKWKQVRQSERDPQVVRENTSREDIEKKLEAERKQEELAKQGTYQQLLDIYIDYLRAHFS